MQRRSSFVTRALLPFAGIVVVATACAEPDGEGYAHDDIGQSQDAVTVCAAGETVKGVDVSHYQGAIDFAKVKAAGFKFAFMKATEGTGYIDEKFKTNWANAKSAGVLRGAYHFFRPSYDGIAQAKHFVSVMGALHDGDLPPVLDLEVQDGVSDATVIARAKDFLAKVKELSGRTPMIYSGYFFTSLGSPSGFSSYPLWVANWGVSCPNIPSGGWKTWKFWQYTDSGSVGGISGGVDADRFNGTYADLVALAQNPDQKVEGYLDKASCTEIGGWAYDPDTKATALSVKIFADGDNKTGTLVSTVTADDKRDDLCTKIGSCNHGFSIATPDELKDDKAHALRAYATGDAGSAVLLTGSPKSITCAAPVTGTGGSAGASGAGGEAGAAGETGTGGDAGSGGYSGSGGHSGSGATSTGGKPSTGGSAANANDSADSGDDGGCRIASSSKSSDAGFLALAALGLALGARRRRMKQHKIGC